MHTQSYLYRRPNYGLGPSTYVDAVQEPESCLAGEPEKSPEPHGYSGLAITKEGLA